MAGGKLTPRQKMINMMYLVLTALLAMNVSSEILNAFKTVNNSILKSNEMLASKNSDSYRGLEEAQKDPQTAAKAAIWAPYANEVKKLSADMISYIDAEKKKVKELSGLKIVDGQEQFKEDNLDVGTHHLVEEKKGEDLYNRLKKFKADLLSVIKPSDPAFAGNQRMIEQITKDMADFDKTLPISLEVPKSKSGNNYSNDAKGWAGSNFHMTPTIAVITILSKLQNDVSNSETQLVDYCKSQIGQVKVVYDEFQAIASANTNYCMPGDPIEVYAGVGAFSAAAKPTISIAGSAVPLVDGMATWKTTASGAGERSIPVNISFTKPDGSIAQVHRDLKYTIGTPSGAAVMLDQMNVVYIGVDNPMTIQAGAGDEKTSVTGNGGGLSIKKMGGGKYIATATTPTLQAGLKVSVTGGKSFDFPLRVKRIPNPIPTLGGDRDKVGGNVTAGWIKAQSGIVPILDNFDFKCAFRVQSFEMLFSQKGELFRANSGGPSFNDQMNQFLGRAKPKDVIILQEIKVVGCDGQTRKLSSLAFTII